MSDLSPSILITRPQAAAERFEEALRAAGIAAPVTASPLIKIVPTGDTPSLDAVSGVIFTSVNGVEAMADGDLPAWCVGTATAEAARARGWQARSAGGDAEALCERVLADAKREAIQGSLMHLRGRFARGEVATRLSAAGVPTGEAIVYDQKLCGLSEGAKALLMRENPVIVPLFSPRSAAQFAAEVAKIEVSAPMYVVAMSAAVAAETRDLNAFVLKLVAHPSAAEMIDAVLGLLDASDNVEDR
ncbi:uroporphyrinogen-III synthase [Shimia sp. SK013]|uniref:uroporphyrinogen-III synthase n=1 Tax=Shimia sp. SK013 TaxID=1389006 RepID=UPI0006B46288|nr:uroporphyrinogen-III synthase [Shimia sp. SK013]KPA19881.1 uroporphyrinogen-III synthase [Shimia sp. SK013]